MPVKVRAVVVDELPGGGDAALLGPCNDLMWVFRRDATAEQIAAAVSAIHARRVESRPMRLVTSA